MDHLQISLLSPSAKAPARQRAGDLGYDLHADEAATLAPGERAVISAGFAMALPAGVAAFIVPRSGAALREGLSIVNSPGLIDGGYRGAVSVIAINLGQEPISIRVGDRVAQMVLVPALTPQIEVVDALASSEDGRGAAGFGSSGKR